MSLREYYTTCAFAKPSRLVAARTKTRVVSALERATRTHLDTVRDGRACFFPGCRQYASEKHHLVPRSLGGTWDTWNIVSACPRHHGWFKGGLIQVRGNPDEGPVTVMVTILGARCGIRIPARPSA